MLVGLGAFHGVNPAMGWLFAVALGLHRNSRAVLLLSLLPIALGHALAIAVIVGIFAMAGVLLDQKPVRIVSGLALIVWALYHRFYGARHRVRIGLRTGYAGLFLWSAFMGTAHGAGLMLLPALLSLGIGAEAHAHHAHGIDGSVAMAAAAVGVHSLAMFGVTGLVALIVYEWVGVGFLRRGWVNLDLLWTAALLATGAILLMS
jgi:hypothetical protein